VDAVKADAAVDLVAVEADERQRSHVHLAEAAVGLLHPEIELQRTALRRLEAEAVLVVRRRNVAREGVQAVRPPEARPVILIEREDLLRQPLAAAGAYREVTVEDVEHLGAVLHEETMPDALVADAVADHEVVGPMDGEPAVVAVPDRGADDGA